MAHSSAAFHVDSCRPTFLKLFSGLSSWCSVCSETHLTLCFDRRREVASHSQETQPTSKIKKSPYFVTHITNQPSTSEPRIHIKMKSIETGDFQIDSVWFAPRRNPTLNNTHSVKATWAAADVVPDHCSESCAPPLRHNFSAIVPTIITDSFSF